MNIRLAIIEWLMPMDRCFIYNLPVDYVDRVNTLKAFLPEGYHIHRDPYQVNPRKKPLGDAANSYFQMLPMSSEAREAAKAQQEAIDRMAKMVRDETSYGSTMPDIDGHG